VDPIPDAEMMRKFEGKNVVESIVRSVLSYITHSHTWYTRTHILAHVSITRAMMHFTA